MRWTKNKSARWKRGLSEDELAVLDLLKEENLGNAERERQVAP